MNPTRSLAAALLAAIAPLAQASTLMLNFRSTSTNAAASGNVAAPYLTLSPAHQTGAVPLAQTSWNQFSTPTGGALVYSDGSAATGVSVSFGHSTAGGTAIDFTTTSGINTAALYGSGGGTTGQLSLTNSLNSIYGSGQVSGNSAVGRAGWLGAANTAIGVRVDGLAPGDYVVYVMARNTNTNSVVGPMNLYADGAATATSFDFASLVAETQSNVNYANTNATAYDTFVDGENYVALNVTLGAGESLFLASDGASATELRGFLNMVQIVAVPEPPAAALGAAVGLLGLLRRRRP